MASRQRTRAPKKKRTPNQFVDLGIFNVPDLDVVGLDDDTVDEDDDSDLESELEAILSGKTKPARPKKKVAAPLDIEKLAAECMKDPSERESDDENLTDPDLLKELKSLTCESLEESKKELNGEKLEIKSTESKKDLPAPGPSQKSPQGILPLLEERLESYNCALSAAKALGDNSKIRRYGRGIKNLKDLIKSAELGADVDMENIPPIVSIPKVSPQTPEPPPPSPHSVVSPASEVPDSNIKDNLIDVSCLTEKKEENSPYLTTLKNRRQKYKVAALEAKKAGNKVTALECMKNLKILDAVIEKVLKDNEHTPVDISTLPPSPPLSPAPLQLKVSPHHPSKKEHEETQTSSIEAAALSAASEPEDPTLFAAPAAPNSVLEALQQRLEKYQLTKSAAEAEGNLSKVRRLERIVKSYEKAIKDFKAGKIVDYENLATPPGFAPIPVPTQENVSPVLPSSRKIEKPLKKSPEERERETVISPPKRPAPEVPSKNVQLQKPKVQRTNTLGDTQLQFLLERQRLFREAALNSKKDGNIQEAKEYLRMSKGFDSMIEATRCGLPIDLSSIPTPPQLNIDSDFVIVDRFECADLGVDSDFELFEILHKDLTRQVEICKTNKELFFKLGDVSSASKFEKLGLESQKDLSIIHHMKKAGQAPPKFHYETRMFSIVKCNADLSEDQLEVTVERGINLPGKADELDSYVKLEFAIPSDAPPQKAKTNVIRDTNNPIFQEVFTFHINRKSRAALRQFKRQCLKLEIFAKGGFLRSDSIIGTVSIKLIDLESTCTIHDCFDLMDNRKSTGGKLEIKIRIRQPLLVKQVEQVQEKWLVIGS